MIILNDKNFNDEIKTGLTIVDCWAEWCGPCKMIAPIFEDLSNEIKDVKFCKYNVDENVVISSKFSVTSIPTMLMFKDGELVDRFVGFRPKDSLKRDIEKHL